MPRIESPSPLPASAMLNSSNNNNNNPSIGFVPVVQQQQQLPNPIPPRAAEPTSSNAAATSSNFFHNPVHRPSSIHGITPYPGMSHSQLLHHHLQQVLPLNIDPAPRMPTTSMYSHQQQQLPPMQQQQQQSHVSPATPTMYQQQQQHHTPSPASIIAAPVMQQQQHHQQQPMMMMPPSMQQQQQPTSSMQQGPPSNMQQQQQGPPPGVFGSMPLAPPMPLHSSMSCTLPPSAQLIEQSLQLTQAVPSMTMTMEEELSRLRQENDMLKGQLSKLAHGCKSFSNHVCCYKCFV